MKTFKPSDEDLPDLKAAAAKMKEGNRLLSVGKKLAEVGKSVISDWLKKNRDTNLDALPIGEMITIENVVFIEIGSMNKFDEATFQVQHGVLHAEFKKDLPVKRFKALE